MRNRAVPVFVACFLAASGAVAQVDALHVTVLTPDGDPRPGALVEFWRFEGRDAGYNNLDLEDSRNSRRAFKLPTARAGTTAVHVPAGIPYRIHVDVAPYAIEDRRWLYAGGEVTVELREGGIVTGVVKRDDGELMVDAQVEMRHRDGASRRYTKTNAEGVFRFERVRPGDLTLEALTPSGAIPEWVQINVASGETEEVEIVVAKGARLHGRVVDDDTGKPVANAEVGIGWVFDKSVRTDANGRYSIQGLGGPYGNDIFARADDYVTRSLDRPSETEGDVEREFRVSRGFSVTGRIVDPDGRPVKNCYVGVIKESSDWRSAYTDADGRYHIHGVVDGANCNLFVRHERFAWTIHAMPKIELDKDGVPLAFDDVQLRDRRILRGELRSGDIPLRDMKVKLRGCNDDAPQGRVRNLLSRTIRTDDHGRFFFGNLPAGSYTVEADGHKVDVTVRPDGDPDPIVLKH